MTCMFSEFVLSHNNLVLPHMSGDLSTEPHSPKVLKALSWMCQMLMLQCKTDAQEATIQAQLVFANDVEAWHVKLLPQPKMKRSSL